MSSNSGPRKQRSVVGRVSVLLDTISSSHVPLTLSDVARRSNLPLTTAHRLLNELVENDLVTRANKRFVPNLHMFEMGLKIQWVRALRETAEPLMHEYASQNNYIVNLAVLSGPDIVYIAKVAGPRAPETPSHVGGRLPAHCTALGKLLLGHLDPQEAHRRLTGDLVRLSPYSTVSRRILEQELAQVRVEGVAHDREEVLLGLSCVAVPVRSHGHLVAALSVSGRTDEVQKRTDPRSLQELAFRVGNALDVRTNHLPSYN